MRFRSDKRCSISDVSGPSVTHDQVTPHLFSITPRRRAIAPAYECERLRLREVTLELVGQAAPANNGFHNRAYTVHVGILGPFCSHQRNAIIGDCPRRYAAILVEPGSRLAGRGLAPGDEASRKLQAKLPEHGAEPDWPLCRPGGCSRAFAPRAAHSSRCLPVTCQK